MSIRAVNHVWENSKQTEGSLLLMLAIADYAHDDGTGAYPSMETLARKSRMDKRYVRKLLRKLEASGDIKTVAGAGPNGVNVYSIPMGEVIMTGGRSLGTGGGGLLMQEGEVSRDPQSVIKPLIEPLSRKDYHAKGEFEAFWKAYPKKVAKANAQRAWKKITTPLPDLLSSLEKFKRSEQWRDPQFIPHAATWLNGRRWEDEISVPKKEFRSCL